MTSVLKRSLYALVALFFGVSVALVGTQYIRDRFIATQLDPESGIRWYTFLVQNLQWGMIIASGLIALLVYLILAFREEARASAHAQIKDVVISQGQFKTMYELGPVPYFLLSPDGVVMEPNKAMLRLCKGVGAQIEGQSLRIFFAKDDTEMWGEIREKFRRNIAIADTELRIVSFDKSEHDVLFSLYHIDSGTKKGWGLGTFVDITERKQIERAKTEFVSLAAHQLRTPISTIKWYAEMLSAPEAGALGEKQAKYVERIHEGARNMNDLVHTLLNVSRLEMGTLPLAPEETDVSALLTNIIEELAPDIQTKQLEVKTVFDVKPITTDPKLLRIVLQNLVSNAVKYTPEKGTITIRASQNGRGAHIEVQDTGFGIPPLEQDKIFTKLYRAENAKQKVPAGNGLGLYMSKAITKILGGTISFVSELDRGTTFTVTI